MPVTEKKKKQNTSMQKTAKTHTKYVLLNDDKFRPKLLDDSLKHCCILEHKRNAKKLWATGPALQLFATVAAFSCILDITRRY